MGLIDRARAAAKDAQDRVASAARAGEERLSGAVGEARYTRARDAVGSSTRRAADGTRRAGERALDRAGATSGGRRLGEGARRAVSEIQALPLVGLTLEAVAARHGVPTLRKRLRADPADPQRALWLAEALLRTRREMLAVRAAQTVANPGSVALRAATKVAVGLGATRAEPPHLRLLRAAFAGAAGRVHADPTDAEALHVCARVYLVQGMYDDAVRLADLAAAAAPADGRPCATAAQAHLRAGQAHEAARCADLALERGCTLGHEVHAELQRAELMAAGEQGLRERGDAYAERLAMVDRRHRRAYYGVAVGAPGVTWAVTAQETRKTARLAGRLAVGTAKVTTKGVRASTRGAARQVRTRSELKGDGT
ncbi:hypothetical protein ACFP3Q_17035 [Nocardioides sp. GCM10027113]|uniref:hypothetical protein n=1 Tax=unclassified Nocardioides TaxID=2615069 RepID=UPI003623429A